MMRSLIVMMLLLISPAEARRAIPLDECGPVDTACAPTPQGLAAPEFVWELARIHLANAGIFAEIGEYEQAILNLDVAARYEPTNAGIFRLRGVSRTLLGKYAEGIADLSHSIQLDRTNPRAYGERGMAHLFLGEIQEACDDARHLSELRPTESELWLVAAEIYRSAGNPAEAEQAFNEALKLDQSKERFASMYVTTKKPAQE